MDNMIQYVDRAPAPMVPESTRRWLCHVVSMFGEQRYDRRLSSGDEHWGGYREIGEFGAQRRFELAAEVVNLERSVLITGDHQEQNSAQNLL